MRSMQQKSKQSNSDVSKRDVQPSAPTLSLSSSESLEHEDDMGRLVLSAHGVSQHETIEPIGEGGYTNPWILEFKGRNLTKTTRFCGSF